MGVKKGKDINSIIGLETRGIGDYIQNKDHAQSIETQPEFVFGLSLHLGLASNNYAEYTGLILAQLIFSMFKQTEIAVVTDSSLVVN